MGPNLNLSIVNLMAFDRKKHRLFKKDARFCVECPLMRTTQKSLRFETRMIRLGMWLYFCFRREKPVYGHLALYNYVTNAKTMNFAISRSCYVLLL